MLNTDFYKQLDSELIDIINSHPKYFEKKNTIENKKSYAFLMWISSSLGFNKNFNTTITDGPGDHSCDVIINSKTLSGEDIFYVIQSKWSIEDKCEFPLNKSQIKHTLNDFQSILYNSVNSINSKFNIQHSKLIEHVKLNGKVKFFLLDLE